MRLITIIATAVLCLYVSINPLFAVSGDDTYVFAVSACPPWKTKKLEKYAKDVAYACKNDVDVFTSSVQEAFNVPPGNIFTLVDAQATYEGLQEGIKEFARIVPKDSRVFMLFNFHGDLSDINREDELLKDEVLVLWTEEKPFTMLSALALKQWITAKELRGMIDRVKANEIIVTIDACHSGAAIPDILNSHGRDKDWKGREAVMMSSKAEQFSYFTATGSHGLFTLKLSKSIDSDLPSLLSAFDNAANEVQSYINDEFNQKMCAKMLFETLHKKEPCEQTAVKYDPTGLLPEIKINSATQ